MRKFIVVIVGLVLVFAVTLSFSSVLASTSGDEHYNDNSYEQAKSEQREPDDVPGMNRAEDRTRNKDLLIPLVSSENYLKIELINNVN